MAMFEALFELVEDCLPGMVMWTCSCSLDVMPSRSKKTPHVLSFTKKRETSDAYETHAGSAVT